MSKKFDFSRRRENQQKARLWRRCQLEAPEFAQHVLMMSERFGPLEIDPNDLEAALDAWQERVAICLESGLPESEAVQVATERTRL